MTRALQGFVAEKHSKIQEERSPANRNTKVAKAFTQMVSKQSSPAHNVTPKASPTRKISSKIPTIKVNDPTTSKIHVTSTNGASDEQWIDGPRISRSKVAEARHMLKDPSNKKETWVDGPMQLNSLATLPPQSQQYYNGYGFMDSHKKSMIRKWVENQSSQIQRNKQISLPCTWRHPSEIRITNGAAQFKEFITSKMQSSTAAGDDDETTSTATESDCPKVNGTENITKKKESELNLLNTKSNTDSRLDLTGSPLMDNLERLSRTLDILEDDDDDEEIVVPPPLPLIEPLSTGVSREVSMESLSLSHEDIISIQHSRHSLSSEDEIFEIVEVDYGEEIPTQDCCLQVTEEDIAMSMADNPVIESDQDQHPLKILSEENLTVVSTFTGKYQKIKFIIYYKIY